MPAGVAVAGAGCVSVASLLPTKGIGTKSQNLEDAARPMTCLISMWEQFLERRKSLQVVDCSKAQLPGCQRTF